jgi:hypothetical protein
MPGPETPLLPPEMDDIDRQHTLKSPSARRCRACGQFYPCHARMVLDVLQRHRAALEVYARLLDGTDDQAIVLLPEHGTLARTILNGGTLGG